MAIAMASLKDGIHLLPLAQTFVHCFQAESTLARNIFFLLKKLRYLLFSNAKVLHFFFKDGIDICWIYSLLFSALTLASFVTDMGSSWLKMFRSKI